MMNEVGSLKAMARLGTAVVVSGLRNIIGIAS